MAGIKSYSTTAASNNSSPPNGWPEGQAPSSVNDCGRQMMADIRSWYIDAQFADLGDTPSRASATTFKIGSDVTSTYTVNRAIKCLDGSTLYGIITASSYSNPDTTVTVNLDSGSLTASLTSVALAILSPTNRSLPTAFGRKGADVASAATINLSTAAGDFVDVTGTTTITAITSEAAGIERTVRFTGALTLTHNSTSLILPGGANITTSNGDIAIFRSLGSGNWVCVSVLGSNIDTIPVVVGSSDGTKKVRIEADGLTTATTRVWTAPDCNIAQFLTQVVNTKTGDYSSTATTMPADDTAPQNTEGAEFMTLAITPKNANNLLEIDVVLNVAGSGTDAVITGALFQDTTADAINACSMNNNNSNGRLTITMKHYMTAGTTSATTFKVRAGSNSGTTYFNGSAGAREYGGITRSSITIKEYSA
jgi:hypothetical protein